MPTMEETREALKLMKKNRNELDALLDEEKDVDWMESVIERLQAIYKRTDNAIYILE